MIRTWTVCVFVCFFILFYLFFWTVRVLTVPWPRCDLMLRHRFPPLGGGTARPTDLIRRKSTGLPFPGQQSPSPDDRMLSRLSKFGLSLPRLGSVPPARFVSQSKQNSSAGSSAVTELHNREEKSEHGEVSQYVKVSSGPPSSQQSAASSCVCSLSTPLTLKCTREPT